MGDLINRPISKVIDKDYYISFQKMVLNIALRFMNIDDDSYNDQVNFLLSELGSFFNVDRTYLFTINECKETMTYTHEWCNLGIEPEVLTIEKIPLTVFPWWLDQLEHNNLVYIEDVNAMPKVAIAEQNQLLRQKVKSLISVPVLIDNKIVAFIGIDSVKDYKVWSVEKINLLHTMAEVVANGINTINLNKKVHYLAYHDSLSGLKNSFSLKLHLDEIVKKAKNNKSNVGVFFIDVDGFKFVNDALGHLQGDKLIRQVGERLSNLCNEDEEVFRVGGDDFVLTSRKCSCDREFNEIANRVLKAFIEPFILNNQAHMITVSIGGSIYPENGVDRTTLLESADMAMYMQKD